MCKKKKNLEEWCYKMLLRVVFVGAADDVECNYGLFAFLKGSFGSMDGRRGDGI